ncbi:CUE domain-containing protein [Phyllobacterium sp. LjRoot231]|uniref:CUE domain-containing protein n=1 Tax=Phyllobacterium sp. LjRoot231 TaxID=3342289 RepID=UPI003ECF1E0D
MNETALKHDDDVERLIAEHNGDVQAAIEILLSERSFLIKELEYASLAMGYGFARGWKPKLTSKS